MECRENSSHGRISPQPVTPHDFPEIRWRGHWIWIPEEPIVPTSPFGGDTEPQPESHGLVHVSVTAARLTLDSPVPAVVELPGRAPLQLAAGSHEIELT